MSWGPAVPVKTVMAFLIRLFVYFHVFSHVFKKNSNWLKGLETEIMYFEIIACLKYLINSFAVY